MNARKDKVIRSTDVDALSSRYFAVKKDYIDDPYMDIMVDGLKELLPFTSNINFSISRNLKSAFETPKLPAINRGTYIRTKSIDLVVEQFLRKFKEEPEVQVVSIGAGSDTRPFKFLSLYSNLKYFEYDFVESVKIKKAIILRNKELSSIVKFQNLNDVEKDFSNYQEFLRYDENLFTPNYNLCPIDLRLLGDKYNINSLQNLNPNIPTLILGECVLCYMEPADANQVIKFFHDNLNKSSILLYEPIGGDDNFGNVMVKNLSSRGISLPNLMHYNTLEKQFERFTKELKIENLQIADMNFVLNNWIDGDELNRINHLEFLDEVEEIVLMNKHYCLILAQWGDLNFKPIQKFQLVHE
ncbi:hypothetical protein PACTADRAFT_43283 [Pachysolen tannophilus NRRL Y-2460]|uniref:Leucine carboxyl methyltransferase 1 n=1 Tax=Pachysolen tannophilus NRRL Y-2460 TaxID=669874 RepID=A0A1E4TSI6_PACTA|nr:hypothetical protein PACTADRAFT_43283 [Pachysolen tannophilus NRRL Y-2460]